MEIITTECKCEVPQKKDDIMAYITFLNFVENSDQFGDFDYIFYSIENQVFSFTAHMLFFPKPKPLFLFTFLTF